MLLYEMNTVDTAKHKKHKKWKKRKHHKRTSGDVESEAKFDDCDKLSDPINLSTEPVSHKHRTASDATFVHSHCELQDKKSHKRKRKRHQYDVFDQPKHCKYQKVECDDGISVEESVHEDNHNDSSSKTHTFDEKLPKQLLSGMLQDTDNSQQQEKHRKKKKKMKNLCHPAVNSHGPPYDADCGLLRQRNQNKRSKKVRHDEDLLPHENLSKDLSKRSSSPLPVSSVNVDSDSENIVLDAITTTSKDSEVVLVSELADVSPDEVKYVERVYKEHKSGKLKRKQLTVNADIEAEGTDKCPVVFSEVPASFGSEVHNHSPTKTSSSEQHMNSKDILKLLHADNSLSYLKTEAAVKKAGLQNYCRFGTWSKEENKQLKKNWKKATKECPLTDKHLLLMRSHGEDDETAVLVKDFIESTDFYIRLGRKIFRTNYGVYVRARKMFHPGNYGKFTDDEVLKLHDLYADYGNKWKVIGQLMKRSGPACRDKWRITRQVLSDKPWSDEEQHRLQEAVRQFIGESRSSLESFEYLPWTTVSDYVGTRTCSQCRLKWLFHADDFSTVHFPLQDRIQLINDLIASKAETFKDVDWHAMWKKFSYLPSPQSLEFRVVSSLYYHLPNFKENSFQENLKRLLPLLQCGKKKRRKMVKETTAT